MKIYQIIYGNLDALFSSQEFTYDFAMKLILEDIAYHDGSAFKIRQADRRNDPYDMVEYFNMISAKKLNITEREVLF